MENASKALIIVASVLISLMVISLGVYLYATMSEYATSTQEQIEQDKINSFNNKFLKYDTRTNLTIYDIITIANYARETNENNEYYIENGTNYDKSTSYISVVIKKKNGTEEHLENKEEKELKGMLKDEEFANSDGTLQEYKCNVLINENTLKVYKVELIKNKVK